MKASISIAPGVTFPLDIVTQTIAIIAKRRAGKSYTMRRLVEELYYQHQQVVLVDPKGDQWGVRSSVSGKTAGLQMLILGGERGDVPIESNSGEVVARLVVEERVSAVLDLSIFRKSEVAVFMAEFLETLYRLKAKEANRTPMMLVIDEADAIAPQKPMPNEARMLGAAEDIVRRGGQRGIGCTLVTQRSAVLNKNVLTQAQMLIVLRTIAPQDIKAMQAWVEVHGEEEQAEELLESLPSLPTGTAWFWSPGWPTDHGIFKKAKVTPIFTFDSGASPEPGQAMSEPKTVAEVDLAAVQRQMASALEAKKQNDPKELQKIIIELKRQHANDLRVLQDKLNQRPVKQVEQLVPVLRDDQLNELVLFRDDLMRIEGLVDFMMVEVKELSGRVSKHEPDFQTGRIVKTAHVTPIEALAPMFSPKPNGLPVGEVAVLTAVLQFPGLERKRLSILTGYKRSTRDAYISRLVEKGLIDVQGQILTATKDGARSILFNPLPTGKALAQHWLQKLPDGEAKILREALRLGKAHVFRREWIDEQTGFKRSTRDAYLSRMKARGVIVEAGRNQVMLSTDLFD